MSLVSAETNKMTPPLTALRVAISSSPPGVFHHQAKSAAYKRHSVEGATCWPSVATLQSGVETTRSSHHMEKTDAGLVASESEK